MKTMIRWALLTVTLAVNAAAQEWTGLYVGLAADGVQHQKEWTDVLNNNWGGTVTQSHSKLVGRFLAGANRQMGATVLGLEADYLLGNVSDGGSMNSLPPDFERRDELESMITLRGRYGFALENILLYGTAGVAQIKVRHSLTANNDPADTASVPEYSDTQTGLVYGLGIEHRFMERMSFRLEFMSTMLGAKTVASNVGDPYEVRDSVSRLSGGILYHF